MNAKLITFLTAVLLGATAGLVGGVWYLATTTSDASLPPQPITLVAAKEELPAFDVLLIQNKGDSKKLFHCRTRYCQPEPIVASYESDALTDGQVWYHYSEENGKKILKQTSEDKQTKTLIEQTPLARPRELLLSPSGERLVFWLDNIDRPTEHLTELWLYDTQQEATQVVVEKLNTQEIITKPRWNRAGTYLWFITRQQNQYQLQLVGVQPKSIQARFVSLNWQVLQSQAAGGPMDIDFLGTALAYVEAGVVSDALVIAKENELPQKITSSGKIVYVEWLPNGSFIYIVQQPSHLEIWQAAAGSTELIANQAGQFQSAHRSPEAAHLLVATKQEHQVGLFAVNIEKRTITAHSLLPTLADATHIIKVNEQHSSQVASVTTTLADEEVIAFIDRHLPQIAGEPVLRAQRMLVTDQPNTVFIDFRHDNTAKRVLVTVRDAIHPEWVVRARYISEQGAWQPVFGGEIKPPEVVRVYEWEAVLNQWIRKDISDTRQPAQNQV